MNEEIITMQQLATTALHAIYPIVLDNFWTEMTLTRSISGGLCKRYTCAPAGSAFVFSLRNGLTDIKMVFPGVYDQNSELFDKLEAEYEYLRVHRWSGSINHNYYGAERYEVDESLYFGLASVVYGVYQEFVPDAKLIGSNSLSRLAGNAPLIGAVLGTVLRQVTRSSQFVEAYISQSKRKQIVNV